MKNTLTKLAAAGVLTLTATAAFAGSITQPGETLGLASGAPLPPGFYFVDTTDWGVRTNQPGGTRTAVGVTIPVIAWSTPWKVLGGRLIVIGATPAVEAGNTGGVFNYVDGVYNPFIGARLAWDLGGGLGFSYTLGGYAKLNTTVAHDSNTLVNGFALSYTANGWNLTGNAIYGVNDKQVGTTNSISNPNPDYFNLDVTATRKFGKWEVGPVAFGSSDTSDPFPGYLKQSQIALGALVGYNFGEIIVQSYLTRDVYEKNYGGYDTRVWGRVIVPLGDPFAGSSGNLMYHK